MQRLFFPVFIVFHLNTFLFSQSSPPFISDTVKASIEARVHNRENRSIIVGLLSLGDTVYYRYGTRAAGDTLPPGEHTLFEIGSITKVFTGILLADMVERAEVAAGDPIDKHLPPGVKAPRFEGKPITLEQLATHTSGLPRLPTNLQPADPSDPYAGYDEQKLYTFLNDYTLSRAPGSQYEYSNLGAGLLGHLLARRLDRTYEEAVRDRILQPLGLEETTISLSPEQQISLAPGHSGSERTSNWNLDALAGAGALRSSAHDMLRFLQMNFDPGTAAPGIAMEKAQLPRRGAGQENMRVGYGWHVRDNDRTRIIWHNGGTGGYRSFIGFEPRLKRAVVVLTNSSEGVDDIGFHLLDDSYPLREVIPVANVDPSVLAGYVGRYQLLPDFFITITRDGDQLSLQATGQPRVDIFPLSSNHFFLRLADARITFHTGSEGRAESLTLHQNGMDMPARRVE